MAYVDHTFHQKLYMNLVSARRTSGPETFSLTGTCLSEVPVCGAIESRRFGMDGKRQIPGAAELGIVDDASLFIPFHAFLRSCLFLSLRTRGGEV